MSFIPVSFHQSNVSGPFSLIPLVLFMAISVCAAQPPAANSVSDDTLLTAARELMAEARYCALITIDQQGQPQARTMDPFPPDENMVIWLGTNRYSRKVIQITSNPRVALYYQAPNGTGYVVIKGRATVVDEPSLKNRWWKKEWDKFYPSDKQNFLLIRVDPTEMEIISYRHHITGDEQTWQVPSVRFQGASKTGYRAW